MSQKIDRRLEQLVRVLEGQNREAARNLALEDLATKVAKIQSRLERIEADLPEIQHLQRTIREAYEEADAAEALLREILADTESEGSPTCLEGRLYGRVLSFIEDEAKPAARPRDTLTKEEPDSPEPELPEAVAWRFRLMGDEGRVRGSWAYKTGMQGWCEPEPMLRQTERLYSESTVRSLIERAEKAERERDAVEQRCDPAGDTRTIGELRDTVGALRSRIRELEEELEEARASAPVHTGSVIVYRGEKWCRMYPRSGPAPSDSTEGGETESVEGEVESGSFEEMSGNVLLPADCDWAPGTRVKVTRLPTTGGDDE